MQPETTAQSKVAKRLPQQVMRLERLGSFHQTRLSFMRVLLRRLKQEQWQFQQQEFVVDNTGVGHAVYNAIGPERTYSLIAFAHDLPDELRSDRVIAEQWDTTFTLFDGIPTKADIKRLSENVPLQEAGRLSGSELLWEHVVDALARGVQPDKEQIDSVGYLMRTTAVYGSGKFGAADRQTIAERSECKPPFQVEMLSVYLIRTFVRDLVQHMANVRGGETATELDVDLARSLGIGNSTGLGMAPFIVNHPALFNNWIVAREEAIAQVRSVQNANESELLLFKDLFERLAWSMLNWHTEHELQKSKVEKLQVDLVLARAYIAKLDFNAEYIWNNIYSWSEENLSLEGQECIASLMLEPYGHLIDGFAHCMGSDTPSIPAIDGSMSLAELRNLLDAQYEWAKAIDWSEKTALARAWYVSEEKLEPRLGERFEEPIADYEQPLAPARDAMELRTHIESMSGQTRLSEYLLRYPEHRHTVRRVQLLKHLPYGEIQDNTVGAELLPIDMLRCKLSFFGAIHFDPRSDRWVRIRMFGNAPYPEELSSSDADFWAYPA